MGAAVSLSAVYLTRCGGIWHYPPPRVNTRAAHITKVPDSGKDQGIHVCIGHDKSTATASPDR